jgi:glutathione S-transferase
LAEDHKTDKFLKLNPFHKIPVIDDNGFVLKERYIEEKNKSFRKLQLTIMSRSSTVVLAACHLAKTCFLGYVIMLYYLQSLMSFKQWFDHGNWVARDVEGSSHGLF